MAGVEMPAASLRPRGAPLAAAPQPARRSTLVLGGAAIVALSLVGSFTQRWGAASASSRAGIGQADAPLAASGLPEPFVNALIGAWREVDALADEVSRKGLVPHFGRRAGKLVNAAISKAGASGADAAGLEAALDASLRGLYQKQLATLRLRAADVYEEAVASRPNLFEAVMLAEGLFTAAAEELQRPGAGWSAEAERQDLLAQIRRSHDSDMRLIEEQGKRGGGKQVTLEVIRKLQQQASTVQREADTRGALPWDIKWQYMIEKSPFGFRGQYTGGRSVVELLLMPDPRQKDSILTKIGPLNVAVGFDLFM